MLPEKIIYIAVLLNFVGHILYARSITRGHAKPNLVSWFIWMVAPFLGAYFELKAGAGLSILPIFVVSACALPIQAASAIANNFCV